MDLDLMLAAEHFAQAQAAAVAAAQYYAANANAINAAAAAAGAGAHESLPGAPAVVAPGPGYGLPPTSTPHPMQQAMNAAAMITGTTLLGSQFLPQPVPSKAPPLPPPPPPALHDRPHSDGMEVRTSRDDRRRRDRSRDRAGDRRDRSPHRERRRDRSRDRDRRSGGGGGSERRSSRSPTRRDRHEGSPSNSDDDRVPATKVTPPNNTIIIRCLAQHITENNIRQDIQDLGLAAKDIRLIRKKETGASRGFAFVEFDRVEDAQTWMDAKQGVLYFKDQSRALMQYSLPRDARSADSGGGGSGTPKVLHDWICAKCGVQNFRRRDQCFKCNGPKTDGEYEGAEEVSTHPTNTVLLRGLDALSTEDSVLNCLKNLTHLPIKSIRIGRDSLLTNTSRGVCYVEMNSVVDAMFLHNQLLGEPPCIDDKLVSVSYFRTAQSTPQSTAAAANAALAAAQWSHKGTPAVGSAGAAGQAGGQAGAGEEENSAEQIEKYAEYSASLYAKSNEEKASYLEYYRKFYRNGGDTQAAKEGLRQQQQQQQQPQEQGGGGGGGGSGTADKASLAKNDAKCPPYGAIGTVVVDGVEYGKYPVPNVSSYVYDESSSYYYDAQTGLYYDANSQYYFNSSTKQYMFWSADHHTYLPAPAATPSATDNAAATEATTDKGKDDGEKKKDKVMTAKRIAKDMEKWAKTLNQRKEAAKTSSSSSSSVVAVAATMQGNLLNDNRLNSFSSSSEDIAFSMLQKKPAMSSANGSGQQSTSATNSRLPSAGPAPGSASAGPAPPSVSGLAGLAGYGSDSDNDDFGGAASTSNGYRSSTGPGGGSSGGGKGQDHSDDAGQLIDWTKLACLLCKRQFPSKEKLQKHNQISDLHKQNLESWRQNSGGSGSGSAAGLMYRDRAKERRQKYGGEDGAPRPNRLKEKYMRAVEDMEVVSRPVEKNLGEGNIGNKMLQKMGWKEGLGLGKANQGRTSIIEAEQRSHQAGLGSSGAAAAKSNPNDSYKDCVKRTMFQRYRDLD